MGETPAVADPLMSGNSWEDARGESEDKSIINSDVVECNLNTEESKEFQDFDPKVNDDKA